MNANYKQSKPANKKVLRMMEQRNDLIRQVLYAQADEASQRHCFKKLVRAGVIVAEPIPSVTVAE